MEGEIITMQEIFSFERHGIDEEGLVIGQIRPTGLRPSFSEKLRLCGFELEQDLFEDRRVA